MSSIGLVYVRRVQAVLPPGWHDRNRARIAPGGGHVVMLQHGRYASHRFGELFMGQVRASMVHRCHAPSLATYLWNGLCPLGPPLPCLHAGGDAPVRRPPRDQSIDIPPNSGRSRGPARNSPTMCPPCGQSTYTRPKSGRLGARSNQLNPHSHGWT